MLIKVIENDWLSADDPDRAALRRQLLFEPKNEAGDLGLFQSWVFFVFDDLLESQKCECINSASSEDIKEALRERWKLDERVKMSEMKTELETDPVVDTQMDTTTDERETVALPSHFEPGRAVENHPSAPPVLKENPQIEDDVDAEVALESGIMTRSGDTSTSGEANRFSNPSLDEPNPEVVGPSTIANEGSEGPLTDSILVSLPYSPPVVIHENIDELSRVFLWLVETTVPRKSDINIEPRWVMARYIDVRSYSE